VAQGIFRMRKLNVTHKVDFYIGINNKTIIERINNKTIIPNKDFYKILERNSEILKNNSKESMLNQTISYLYKNMGNNNNNSISNLYKKKVYYELEFNNEKNNKDINFLKNRGITIKVNNISLNNIEIDHEIEQEQEKEKEKEKESGIEKDVNKNIYVENYSHTKFNTDFFMREVKNDICSVFMDNELYTEQKKNDLITFIYSNQLLWLISVFYLNRIKLIKNIYSHIILIKSKTTNSYALITRDELFLYKNDNIFNNYQCYDIYFNYNNKYKNTINFSKTNNRYRNGYTNGYTNEYTNEYTNLLIFILSIIFDIEKNIFNIYRKLKIIKKLNKLSIFIKLFESITNLIGVKKNIIDINILKKINNNSLNKKSLNILNDENIFQLFNINLDNNTNFRDKILNIFR
jgi:hypothetical protein